MRTPKGLWLVGMLAAGCARGLVELPRNDAQVARDEGIVPLDGAIDARDDRATDTAVETRVGDAGMCLAIRGAFAFQTRADTTGGVPYDRGWPDINTSNCPLSMIASDVTRATPSRQFHFCNPSPSPVAFSLSVRADFDVWTAVYQGDEVPTDVQSCLAMNDDDRTSGVSTTNSFIPRVTLAPNASVTIVVVGITRSQFGPFDLVATPL